MISRCAALRCGVGLALLAIGCGKSAEELAETDEPRHEPGVTWESGSRLHARILDGGGGATELVGWYDSALDVNCRFSLAEDDVMRCLPEGPDVGPSICDSPVAAPEYGQCPWYSDGARILQLGGEEVPVEETCEAEIFREHGLDSALSLTPVAPEEFVAATERTRPLSDEFDARVLEAEDGSMETIGLQSRGGGGPCDMQWLDGEYLCLPAVMAHAQINFTDAACSDLVAEIGQGAQPEAIRKDPPLDSCDPSFTVHAVGERFDGHAHIFVGACFPHNQTWLDANDTYLIGADITDQVAVIETELAGSERLSVHRVVATGVATEGFRDSETGELCEPQEVDGVTRCMPNAAERSGFKDEQCTEPVIGVAEYGDPCNPNAVYPPPTLFVEGRVPTPRCAPGDSSVPSYFRFGAEWTGMVFAHGDAGACVPVERDPLATYYAMGDPVDPSEFAEMTVRVE